MTACGAAKNPASSLAAARGHGLGGGRGADRGGRMWSMTSRESALPRRRRRAPLAWSIACLKLAGAPPSSGRAC
eukprot:CAMPEP_0170406340 /NCGR_PEP_ID=MMETSP0117_2-20130122/27661_1 /TAXON_ID=400756 /ORGANISM="Durinskia baltica, Strain CSIRO CS-38" /LENGTH=73 /DNA_ID=CAMNT_0010663513 /DNA_START=56 /DNA_END=277 /DNA_ORIENTATION=+